MKFPLKQDPKRDRPPNIFQEALKGVKLPYS